MKKSTFFAGTKFGADPARLPSSLLSSRTALGIILAISAIDFAVPARAACVAGVSCNAASGATLTLPYAAYPGLTYKNTAGTVFSVTTGGKIIGSGLSLTSNGYNTYGAWANGGTILLNGGSITTTNGTKAYGLRASGAASFIKADGLTIASTGAGIVVENSASAELYNLIYQIPAGNTAGLNVTGAGSSLYLENAKLLAIPNNTSIGAEAHDGGTLRIKGAEIETGNGVFTINPGTTATIESVRITAGSAISANYGAYVHFKGGAGGSTINATSYGLATMNVGDSYGPSLIVADATDNPIVINIVENTAIPGGTGYGAYIGFNSRVETTDVAIYGNTEKSVGYYVYSYNPEFNTKGPFVYETSADIKGGLVHLAGTYTIGIDVDAEADVTVSRDASGNGTDVQTSGGSTMGIRLTRMSSLEATGMSVSATGAEARALRMSGNSIAAFNDSTLTSTATAITISVGDRPRAVPISGGDNNIVTLTNSSVTANRWLELAGQEDDHITGTVAATSSTLTGTATTDGYSTSNVTLTGSRWNVTGNSNLTNLVNNSSTIDMTVPTGDPTSLASYKSLTTVNYRGTGGTIGLNTYLGTDGSPSDRLIIDGGTASGHSLLVITNTTGSGAFTTGDGILVIQAVNGATTAADAFMLGNRVAVGAYEYKLFYGGNTLAGGNADDQNWYLRNTITVDSEKPGRPVDPGTPGAREEPIIRPEVPVSMVIPPLAIEYGYAMLDTLHERVGETYITPNTPVTEERAVWCKDPARNFKCVVRVPVATVNGAGKDETRWASSGWARLIGNRGLHQPDNFMRRGPNYDYTFGGIQAGLDIWAREQADGTLDKLGLYVGYGQIRSNVKGQFGGKAGTVDMNAYTLAGYWTHFAPSGWYTDAVIQGTWYSADARSVYGQRAKPDGFGILGSLEAGYAFKLGSGWTLEPQAQIVYQNVSFDNARDAYGFVRFDDGDSLRGRLGLRLSRTWNTTEAAKEPRLVTAWLRANLWHEFLGKTKTSWGSLDGANMTPFNSYLGGTWGEIGAGVTAQVSDKINLFATGAYNRSLDGKGRQGWDGRLGATVRW